MGGLFFFFVFFFTQLLYVAESISSLDLRRDTF